MAPAPTAPAATRPYRICCAVMAVIFVLSAALQWNDPDPVPWIAFYGFAALTAFAALVQARVLPVLEVSLAVLALGVGLAFAPALGSARIEAVTSIQMKSAEDEEVRELGGSAIVLGFAAGLLIRGARPSRSD